jgi:hypothetical protein
MIKHTVAFVLGVCLLGCSSSSNPSAPSAKLTPAPIPTPTPTPTPENLLKETYCVPAPPPLHKIKLKLHLDFGYKKVLDSRAFVGPDAAYCASIGLPGDICVVRDENDPLSVTCNNLALGKASDTGRYGPTWSWEGQPCRPPSEGANDPGCRNHETNQFFIYAFGSGTYTACGPNGVCNSFVIE